MSVRETLRHTTRWNITKYASDSDFALGRPYASVDIDGNLLLNEGITELLTLGIGGTATAYSNANARLGTGTSTTGAQASDTGLLANAVFAAMDATYPQVANQTVTFRSTFDGNTANQSWQEFSVDNGNSGNKNLNRKVSNQGIKESGQTWVLTLTITLA